MDLPRLDSQALRGELALPAVLCALAPHRASLMAHPQAKIPAGFALDFDGDSANIFTLATVLGRALRPAGLASCKAREALIAETQHLVLVLAGLVDDFAPRVSLVMVDADGPMPEPPWLASSRLALIHTFDLGEGEGPSAAPAALLDQDEGELRLDLPPGTAAVLKVDPGVRVRCAPAQAGGGRRLMLWVASEREPDWIARGGGGWARLSPAEPVDVLLVSMPFGPVVQPSLGLGLLKSALPPGTAKVLYLSLAFARRIGRPLYHWINDRLPFATTLAGEWLFRPALLPEVPEEPRQYLDEVLLAPTARWREDAGDPLTNRVLVPEGLVDDLLGVRGLTDDYLDWCAGEVLAHRPKIVGLTSVFEQHAASLALARRLKERSPETRIVLGGANCEGVMGLATLRAFGFVDAVVSGEGEVALPQLVARWLAGEPAEGIQGVYTRRSPAVLERAVSVPNAASPRHLDDLPYPDFDDFFAQFAESGFVLGREARLLFESSRGCWWGEKMHCTFCSLNGAAMAYRSKSAGRALAELRWLTGRYPGRSISTVDNILDMQYFKTFLPILAEERLDVEIFYEVKSNLRKDQIRLLRDAGVRSLQAGVESLSDEILQIMGKGVSGLQNIRLLKWCEELGVWPYWNLLWGFPGESPEEYARMAEMIPWLHHLPPPTALSPIFLERFSPNYFRSSELGFAGIRPMSAYRHIYPSAGEELGELAYFFDYGYQDGRDVAGYVGPLIPHIVEWRDVYTDCTLAAIDLGERLAICDTRPAAVESLSFLVGLERDLYLACDGITTVERLRSSAGAELSREQVEDALRPLLDRGLLLRQGDTVLALAIARPLDD
ncbi:MAG: RiPP maturation radical SAM C-methyltransferase [Thermoanaerobaculia bacterium]